MRMNRSVQGALGGAAILAIAIAPAAIAFLGCAGAVERLPGRSAASSQADSGAAPASAAPAATSAPRASAGPEPPKTPPPPPNAGSTKVTVKTDPAWAACHHGYEAKKKDPVKDVAALSQGCANVAKLTQVGKTLTGKQSDQDPPQSFPLAAEAGHCYRLYAQGSEGIRDLDVAIKDSTGALAGEDATDDPSPVLLDDGLVCFKVADAATVIVSVGLGKGTYALEIWKD
jgi:hypothetical protein